MGIVIKIIIIGLIFISINNLCIAQSSCYSKSYAIVIGISDYSKTKDWCDIITAVNDANAISAFLENQGFKVVKLLNSEATKENIISAIQDSILPLLNKDDCFLFYFSGHGDTSYIGNKKMGFLIPYHEGNSNKSDYLSDLTLLKYSKRMKDIVRHQLFVVDACFSGQFLEVANLVPKSKFSQKDVFEKYSLKDLKERPAYQLISSGGMDQESHFDKNDNLSLFTACFLKGIEDNSADNDANGYITFSEISAYVKNSCGFYDQTPIAESFFTGGGDFIIKCPPKIDNNFNPNYSQTLPIITTVKSQLKITNNNNPISRFEAWFGHDGFLNYYMTHGAIYYGARYYLCPIRYGVINKYSIGLSASFNGWNGLEYPSEYYYWGVFPSIGPTFYITSKNYNMRISPSYIYKYDEGHDSLNYYFLTQASHCFCILTNAEIFNNSVFSTVWFEWRKPFVTTMIKASSKTNDLADNSCFQGGFGFYLLRQHAINPGISAQETYLASDNGFRTYLGPSIRIYKDLFTFNLWWQTISNSRFSSNGNYFSLSVQLLMLK